MTGTLVLSSSVVKDSLCELKLLGSLWKEKDWWSSETVTLEYLVQHRPSDQKVPSWNLITATVSRLNSKLYTVIWRPSVQGLTESPVIRNASYYHNPKSYLNRSLMWLWFPRTICCYCSSALLWGREANQKLLSHSVEVRNRGTVALQWHSVGNKCKSTKNKQSPSSFFNCSRVIFTAAKQTCPFS